MDPDEKKCPQCAETVKADALVCRYCGYRFDGTTAPIITPPAPPRKKSRFKALGCFGSLALVAIVVTCTSKLAQPGSQLASSPFGVDTQLQKIKDKVAADQVAQYNIAARGGTAMDRCSQAGMVAAAYLQAQDQPKYDIWKATEKADCAAAGIAK